MFSAIQFTDIQFTILLVIMGIPTFLFLVAILQELITEVFYIVQEWIEDLIDWIRWELFP